MARWAVTLIVGAAALTIASAVAPTYGALVAGGLLYGSDMTLWNIASFNGTAWSRLGGGIDEGGMTSMAVVNGTLYVGGAFHYAGALNCPYLVGWNGSDFFIPGPPLPSDIPTQGMLVWRSRLVLFLTLRMQVVTYDNSSIQTLASTTTDGEFRHFAVHGDDLVLFGAFEAIGDAEAHCVAGYDGDAWFAYGLGCTATPGCGLFVTGMSYGGGLFAGAVCSSGATHQVFRWDGASWSGQDAALWPNVYTPWNGAMHIARTDDKLAVLNGSSFNVVTAAAGIQAMTADASYLYVGGSFFEIGGIVSYRVAKYDGHNWTGVGDGLSYNMGWVSAIVFYEPPAPPPPGLTPTPTAPGDTSAAPARQNWVCAMAVPILAAVLLV